MTLWLEFLWIETSSSQDEALPIKVAKFEVLAAAVRPLSFSMQSIRRSSASTPIEMQSLGSGAAHQHRFY
jgi:hypothetical protein